jgi:hypothetical protein
MIGGKFSLAGDFLYAQEFKGNLFLQTAAFVNNKEAGGSFGLGSFSDTGDLYLFIDSLYSYGKLWTQLRPTARLRFSWMSLTAFYALSLSKSTIQIDGQEIGAANYWGGELNLVPISWARLYGNLISVNGIYTYKFGAEIRPIKWLSISADWNKTDSGIYSKWNSYQDVRVALNFLLGSQHQSFKLDQKIQMQPMYPILTRANSSKPPEKISDVVEFMYVRDLSIINPNAPDPTTPNPIESDEFGSTISVMPPYQFVGNGWQVEYLLSYSSKLYHISTGDGKVSNGDAVADTFYARVRGTTSWTKLPTGPNGKVPGRWANFYLNTNGITIPSN